MNGGNPRQTALEVLVVVAALVVSLGVVRTCGSQLIVEWPGHGSAGGSLTGYSSP